MLDKLEFVYPMFWLFKYDEITNKMYPSMYKGNKNKMATVIHTTF